MKRAFDILASLAGLVLTGWLIVLLALLVRRESDGPGLFRQERVGFRGRPFHCYKLRTMKRETPSGASHDTPAAFVTPLGARLRRYKLDELPQLWNVLKGEMSLVGPRPCLPMQAELIAARERHGAFSVRPGITGRAQVAGIDMSDPQRLAVIDGAYASGRSFIEDIRIIVATVLGSGRGDRVALEAMPLEDSGKRAGDP
ncbi:sugar transferase [Fulvimarina sp. 2208YS6-2-32]|uniref:Sugar transferase n=1 Tax=Fulvimarina uroteuthidis TaxID=3098149 RepID=A0ABU5I706_9HYPH|nr:sugar transferase [Fulvimarina sp. 2208YS6-2-32]MDY8111181.1 sugar transferase [Fulvimarina sp. 2208YS6-2-32]